MVDRIRYRVEVVKTKRRVEALLPPVNYDLRTCASQNLCDRSGLSDSGVDRIMVPEGGPKDERVAAGGVAVIQVVCLLLAISVTMYYFVQRMLHVVCQKGRFKYPIFDLFIVTTAVALLCGAGFPGDAIVLGAFFFYTLSVGPIWGRFVITNVSHEPVVVTLTSAAILSSFVAILTGTAMLLLAFLPGALASMPGTALMLYSSAAISFLFILGDNAVNETQLVLYGLPVGALVNVAASFFVGAVL